MQLGSYMYHLLRTIIKSIIVSIMEYANHNVLSKEYNILQHCIILFYNFMSL